MHANLVWQQHWPEAFQRLALHALAAGCIAFATGQMCPGLRAKAAVEGGQALQD